MAFEPFESLEIPTYDFAKDPDEKLDYSFDFSELVGEVEITDQTVSADADSAVIVSNIVLNEGVVSCFVSGGENKTYAVLTFGVELEDGRNIQRDMRLRIENR